MLAEGCRMKHCLLGATCSLLAGAACGAEGPEVPLCDGSTNLTLRMFYEGQPGRGYLGAGVRVENGLPSFAVDGQCRYFMGGGWFEDPQTHDLGWRQGAVSDDLRRALEAKVGAEDLESTYDCSSRLLTTDAPRIVIANTRSAIVCGSIQPIEKVVDFVRQRAGELWEEAQPLEGGLRITVREGPSVEPPRRYQWPAELNLRDYFQTNLDILYDDPSGQSRLVPAIDAAPLRALREEYLRDTRPGILYNGEGIPITDGQTLGTMFMRDALPYEDERGLWPLPGQLQ
jgi:hypothetical protein